jgi:predicted nucleotidyltransferase
MLSFFVRSKHRAAILRIFFANPESQFYLREIAKMINASAGNAQKELKGLEKEGILKSAKRGNLRFYCLNPAYPLFNELSGIISKTLGIEAEIKKELKSLKGLRFAFIFGSYVKKDFGPDSDLDLFIIGSIDEDELIRKIKKAENRINREINYHVAGEREFLQSLKEKSFYQDIITNFILLTDNEHEFKKFIGGTGKKGEA